MSSANQEIIDRYLKIRAEHDKIEKRVKDARLNKQKLRKEYEKTEDHLKAI